MHQRQSTAGDEEAERETETRCRLVDPDMMVIMQTGKHNPILGMLYKSMRIE